MLKPVWGRSRYACAHPIRHRVWPEPRDRSPDLLEYRLPEKKTDVTFGYLPRSDCGGKVILDRIYWFGLDCKWTPEPKFELLSLRAVREELKNQPDAVLLTIWQNELKRVKGDRRLITRIPQEAGRRLAEKYQFLVYSENKDHMAEGQLALLKCIDTCKPGRSFFGFANPAIYRAIRDYKRETETGAVYRPDGYEDSFKYRWARPAQKAMLLASEASDGPGGSDLSFDYREQGEEDDDSYEMIEGFEHDAHTFDRQRHALRIELDERLKVLDPRERHIIEQRYFQPDAAVCCNSRPDGQGGIASDPRQPKGLMPISENDGEQRAIKEYLEPDALPIRKQTEHAELGKFFGITPQRVSQIEARAKTKLKSCDPCPSNFPSYDPHFVTPRWNNAIINWSIRRAPRRCCHGRLYDLGDWYLKRAPRPRGDHFEYWCGRLAELLFQGRRHWTKPQIYETGWKWSKPTISDNGWHHSAADVWNPVPDSARSDPKWEPWPYPPPSSPTGSKYNSPTRCILARCCSLLVAPRATWQG